MRMLLDMITGSALSIAGQALAALGLVLAAAALGYLLVACIAMWLYRHKRIAKAVGALRPVTVLKPLCGAEPALYEDLRSQLSGACRRSSPGSTSPS